MSYEYSHKEITQRERNFKSYFAPRDQRMSEYDPYHDPSLQRYFKLPTIKLNLESVVIFTFTQGLLKKKKKKRRRGSALGKMSPPLHASCLPSIKSTIDLDEAAFKNKRS